MQNTNNFGLLKPERLIDNISINVINGNMDTVDVALGNTAKFEKAGGTATAITLTGITLIDGRSKNFIVKADNNSGATTINGKPLYKPGTTTAPKLKMNSAVTVWYDLTSDCFFIKASAGGGTALAGDVLEPKTFTNEDDSEIQGTMPNRGAVSQSLAINGTYNVPEGYHNGSGSVTQSIPTKAAATYIPGTIDQEITSGQYLSGKQTIKGDADLISANILKGKDIFGVVGTLDHVDITGQGTASGICHETISKGNLVSTRRHFGFDTPLKLTNPASLPTGNGQRVAYSADGIYLAVGNTTTSPFLHICKRSGDTYTKLVNTYTGIANAVYGVAWSPDGTYLAVAVSGTAPYLAIYKRSGDTFTKLTDPSVMPAGGAQGLTFSSDGVYLAVVHVGAPYITIYKRSGDTFTKLTDPAISPVGTGRSVAFSSDLTYLVVGHDSAPYITIYKRSGDTFTKLADPTALPTGIATGVAWSPDGTYLAVSQYTSPRLHIYKRSGDTFTKLTNPATMPPYDTWGVAFSSDGTYLTVLHGLSPYITIYKRSGDTFTKLADPAILPTGTGRAACYNPVYPHLAVAHDTSPFVTIYKADIEGDYLYKYNAFSDLLYPNYINFGFAKEEGVTDDIIDITTIPIK